MHLFKCVRDSTFKNANNVGKENFFAWKKWTGLHKVSNNIVNYYLAGMTDLACKSSSFAPGYVLKT